MGSRLVYPVDVTPVRAKLKVIEERLGCSKAEAIRESIGHYAEYCKGLEVVTYRDVPKEQAKREILEYLEGKQRVWTDEILLRS